jgi:hypothetical protein
MPELWTPGMAGPLEELVKRIHRQIDEFKHEHGLEQVAVAVTLIDGAFYRLARLSPEPGYGFVTLCPHCDQGEPEELIVPLGAIKQVRIGGVEEEQPLGFMIPSAPSA